MTKQIDLEAGVNPPSIPAPVLVSPLTGQVTQQADLKVGLHPPRSLASASVPSSRAMQQAEIETGAHSPNIMPSDSVSTAVEQIPPANQLHQRVWQESFRPKTRAFGPAEQFFETLQAVLDHGTRHHCLFFCWELGINDQRAAPLLIEDIENEVRIYQDLMGKRYEKHGRWWKYVPFYGVVAVEEVDLRFMKKNDHDFSVLVGTLDIPQITARLTSELEKADARVDRTADPDDPGGNCEQDMLTGRWGHYHHSCMSQEDNYLFTCAIQSQRECERNLNQLGLLGLPLLCFQNPEIAAGQRTLQGLAQESGIYRTSEIRGSSYFESRIAEAKFRGLMIRWGFTGMRRPFDVPVLALMIVTL